MKFLVSAYTDHQHRKPQLLLCCQSMTLINVVHVKLGLVRATFKVVNTATRCRAGRRSGLSNILFDHCQNIPARRCRRARWATRYFSKLLHFRRAPSRLSHRFPRHYHDVTLRQRKTPQISSWSSRWCVDKHVIFAFVVSSLAACIIAWCVFCT